MSDADLEPHGSHRRYTRDTLEFSRVVNLSDALFAIALTLLVFTLDASAVSLDRVDGVLLDQAGPLVAFALSIVALLHLLLLARSNAVAAWRRPMPAGLFPWLLAGWGASTFVTLLGLTLAFIVPVAGLVLLLFTWPIEALVAWRAPSNYRDWG